MARTFNFELVTPERVVFSTPAEEVLVPGADGDFTVLPDHAPMISTLRPGMLEAKLAGGKISRIFLHGGFCGRSICVCNLRRWRRERDARNNFERVAQMKSAAKQKTNLLLSLFVVRWNVAVATLPQGFCDFVFVLL